MEATIIAVKIKQTSEAVYNMNISSDATVLDLKNLLQSQTDIPAANQKLIFRGKILKDSDTLSVSKVEDGCTMHFVQSKVDQSQPVSDSSQAADTTSENASNFLFAGGSAGSADPSSNNALGATNLNGPVSMFAQTLQGMISNPQAFQNTVNSNPALSMITQANPQLHAMVQNPSMLQGLLAPGVLNGLSGLIDGVSNIMTNFNAGNLPQGENQAQQAQEDVQASENVESVDETNAAAQNDPGPEENSSSEPTNNTHGTGIFSNILSNPDFNQFLQQSISNPVTLQNMVTSNPMFGLASQLNPGFGAMMQNPNFVQNLFSPTMLSNVAGLMDSLMESMGPTFAALNNDSQEDAGDAEQVEEEEEDQEEVIEINANEPESESDEEHVAVEPTLEETYKDELLKLEAMGFYDKQLNLEALQATDGSADAAVERIISMV